MLTEGSTANWRRRRVPKQPRGWLARAGHVPADLVHRGHGVVAVRTRLVDLLPY